MYHCFFRQHVCLSNLKHAPSRGLPLTTRKTVFSHLNANEVIAFCPYLVTKNQDVEKTHYNNVAFVFRLFNQFHWFQVFSYFSISNEGILAKLSLTYNH